LKSDLTTEIKKLKFLKTKTIINNQTHEPSAPLTPEEQETINSMTGVKWKPRQRYIGFKFSRSPLSGRR
jgi:hypothetical protein